jgi:hypothetical protein
MMHHAVVKQDATLTPTKFLDGCFKHPPMLLPKLLQDLEIK